MSTELSHTNAPHRPAWLNIDLDAIRANVAAVQGWIGADARVMAVVKANAYGHGLLQSAQAALSGGAAALGVAIPEEGLALRASGVTSPILVMGACAPEAADDVLRHGMETALSTPDLLCALQAAAAREGRSARVHIKVDTGMGRIGVLPPEAPAFIARAAAAPGLEWVGLMTHFATADEDDFSLAREQWRRFSDVVSAVMPVRQALGGAPGHPATPLLVHAANSAAVCRLPGTYRGLPEGSRAMVRAGLLVYGVPPVSSGPLPDMRPALSLRARVAQARNVPAGCTVSYGATYTTRRTSRLAVIPLGYADGYSRANSNRAQVLLRGCRVPVIGRICMDQFVVDATHCGAEVGDEVVLLGRQGDEEITAIELAGWSDTIHHEVLARLSDRLPRVYLHSGIPNPTA